MKQDVNILKGNLSQEEAISKAAIVIKKLSIQLKDKEILLITQNEEFKEKENQFSSFSQKLTNELSKIKQDYAKLKDTFNN